MKKTWLILLLCLSIALLLAGCTSNADTMASPNPSQSPVSSPSYEPTTSPMTSPMTSASPGTQTDDANMTSTSASGGITTLEDAKKASEAMEEAIEKLTEVDDAYVVPIGNVALVAVEFGSQYQGSLDERLQKMILTRLQGVNRGITSIAVATDEANTNAVKELADALEDANSLSTITAQADALASKLTTYK